MSAPTYPADYVTVLHHQLAQLRSAARTAREAIRTNLSHAAIKNEAELLVAFQVLDAALEGR